MFKRFFVLKTSKKIRNLRRAFNFFTMLLLVVNMSYFGMFFNTPSANASNGESSETTQMCAAPVDVVLIIDRSGSMRLGDCTYYENQNSNQLIKKDVTEDWCNIQDHHNWTIKDDKLGKAMAAANSFIGLLKATDQSALISFANDASLNKGLSNNHIETITAINSLKALGATNIGGAIALSNTELSSTRANPQAAKIAILLTDGQANKPNGNGNDENTLDVQYAKDQAAVAADAGYKIFTIGLGSDINAEMLQAIASSTHAQYYSAPSAEDLQGIYDQISQRICQYGSISGHKYIDSNNDGDISGESTDSGWLVKLTGAATSSQLTDANGDYIFSGLYPGDYFVSEDGKVGIENYTQTYPASSTPYGITLSEGQNIKDKDFGNYVPGCGNGQKDDAEVCDNGEQNGKACVADYGSTCNYCSSKCQTATTTGAYCGDKLKNGPEACDGEDGIKENQSCSETCTITDLPDCDENTSDCQTATSTAAYCGDDKVDASESADNEQCDDGNTSNGDGCNSTCQWESTTFDCSNKPENTVWNTVSNYAQTCTASDGKICLNWSPANTTSSYSLEALTDACHYKCVDNYTWNGAACIYNEPICGNGKLEAGEECDDGNTSSGDACSSNCKIETNSGENPGGGGSGGGGGGGGGGGFVGFSITNPQITMQCSGNRLNLTMTWLTSFAANSRVVYDTSSHAGTNLGTAPNYNYASSTLADATLVTGHSVAINNLLENHVYYFRPISFYNNADVVGEEKVLTQTLNCTGSSNPSEIVVLGEEGEPLLSISNTINTPFANPGTKGIEYTLTVKNNGNLTSFDTILKDTLPEGMTFSQNGLQEENWNLGDLAPGDIRVIKVLADVSKDADLKNYINTATTSSSNNEPVSASSDLDVRLISVLAESGFSKSEFGLLLALLLLTIGSEQFLKKKLSNKKEL